MLLTNVFMACCTLDASLCRAGMRSLMNSLAMLLVVATLLIERPETLELATLQVSASCSFSCDACREGCAECPAARRQRRGAFPPAPPSEADDFAAAAAAGGAGGPGTGELKPSCGLLSSVASRATFSEPDAALLRAEPPPLLPPPPPPIRSASPAGAGEQQQAKGQDISNAPVRSAKASTVPSPTPHTQWAA
eukprot:CAMPEP_0115326164 /NCGR_PEP_ID=MMETSP0270-20121206/83416_1 /TAXON_ID=71861 /ORGANISM="Scrippsiella trochoidea, Strain CCMP3099" /LENGTH=192 /DNA_ID=CAMNT_0002746431 /DNA_START=277 /DNA_END=851 /DNA_ORIENTATION=+